MFHHICGIIAIIVCLFNTCHLSSANIDGTFAACRNIPITLDYTSTPLSAAGGSPVNTQEMRNDGNWTCQVGVGNVTVDVNVRYFILIKLSSATCQEAKFTEYVFTGFPDPTGNIVAKIFNLTVDVSDPIQLRQLNVPQDFTNYITVEGKADVTPANSTITFDSEKHGNNCGSIPFENVIITTTPMPSYKLTYFNGRGLGEVSRLIFAAAGQKFEDVRYERDQFPAHKAEMPLGQMPVLEVDGVKLPQSSAIARYLAKEFHLAGKDNFDQAKVDAVVDTVADSFKGFIPTIFEQDPVKKEEIKKKFFTDDLPKHLQNLETLGKLYGNGGHFFVGNQLTWADLYFYNFAQTYIEAEADCLNNFPWLKQNRAEVEKQPKIAEYLKQRPKTAF
ncbi:unnamed protein product [Adineta steineri]|uniref:glutathione transferase n=1 Tax=Adineta steineri TaxID=433720 RepID=A0A819LXS4_9BILA|nr:unnamed protein product [Adineta steineri]CAF3969397.1 unnamed protein product [Adineta steineri]